jgi:phospholipase/lecithinase/hemolysin
MGPHACGLSAWRAAEGVKPSEEAEAEEAEAEPEAAASLYRDTLRSLTNVGIKYTVASNPTISSIPGNFTSKRMKEERRRATIYTNATLLSKVDAQILLLCVK